MAFQPEHSLLRIELPAIHTIDTSSVQNLFGMWSLFSKTSHAMENGKRLENLSWRLWNRETFCCDSQARSRSSIPSKPKAATNNIPMPALSSSLDSISSQESLEEQESSSMPATIPKARPELRCTDCCGLSRSRGRESHISPRDLEKIILSIKETQDLAPIDLPMPTPSQRAVDPPSQTAPHDLPNFQLNSVASATDSSSSTAQDASTVSASQATRLESSASTVGTNDDEGSQTVGSESSSNTEMSTHSVIRGFTPGGAPSSYRSQTNLTAQPTPILKSSASYHKAPSKKKGPMFTIGTSSGEDESSFESRMYKSSLSESLKRPAGNFSSSGGRKQTSFKEEVAVGRAAEHSPVFESDDEDEEVSESAIDDDDDSSDWEDSDDQSGPSSVTEHQLFQRVDSRPNLTSRRSLITMERAGDLPSERTRALQNAASRSTPAMRRSRTSSPNGPSVATSPEPDAQMLTATMNDGSTAPRPIVMTTSNTHHEPVSMSPRSTRRQMLSSELTESLRKNLLWERQHRSTGNLAALKRRHTSNDVKNLRQLPEPGPVLSHRDGAARYNNDYFHAGLQEYHAKGW